MARERVFADPFMLKSEHIRILGSAQERYDRELRLREKIGYWKGIAHVIWGTLFVAVTCASVGFTYGVGLGV